MTDIELDPNLTADDVDEVEAERLALEAEVELDAIDPEDTSEYATEVRERYMRRQSELRQAVYLKSQGSRSWQPQRVGKWMSGKVQRVRPTQLDRQDGQPILYASRLHWVYGDSGGGKSWLACAAAIDAVAHGRNVLWIDTEEPEPIGLLSRLRSMSVNGATVTDEELNEHFFTAAPVDGILGKPDQLAELREFIIANDVRLLILDSVGEAHGLEGIDGNVDAEVSRWLIYVLRPLAATGVTSFVIDHTNKSVGATSAAAWYPTGSQRKRAAADGMVVRVAPSNQEPSRGVPGYFHVACAKDRYGNFKRKYDFAHVWLRPDDEDVDFVHLTIEVPQATAGAPDAVRDKQLIDYYKVLDYIAENSGEGARSIARGIKKRNAAVSRQLLPRLVHIGVVVNMGSDRVPAYHLADPDLVASNQAMTANREFLLRDHTDVDLDADTDD